MSRLKIAVIGGGASGMMAAISAARMGANVTICERFDRIGKKILATGNGRCNLTNVNADKENYHGKNPKFVNDVMSKFWVSETLDFFQDIGLVYKVEDEGKVYPYSDSAASVLDVLRFEIDRLKVNIIYNFEAKEIRKKSNGFIVNSYSGETLEADKIIVATGGKASNSLGSNGSGYPILEKLGHSITELFPSLVQIKLGDNCFKPLNGLKIHAEVSVAAKNEVKKTQKGELLFTDYGVSGPVIFSLSRIAGENPDCDLEIDMMPEYSFSDVVDILKKHRDIMTYTEELFTGVLNKRIAQVIIKNSTELKLNSDIKSITEKDIKRIAQKTKKFKVNCSGTMSWNNAQVTAGGINTSNIWPGTLESKLVKGLYITGEILDIDGDCGGYNLQWAWSTGYIAGENAGRIE